jgi:hypothetical protein
MGETFNGNTLSLKEYNVANLRVSTSFRSNFNDHDSNCVINFTQNRIINNVCKISVNYVSMCNNWYNVASYNNKFVLILIINSEGFSHNITVPSGYYDVYQLCTYLQTLIRSYSVPSCVVAFDETAKKIYINSGDVNIGIAFGVTLNLQNYLGNNFLYLVGLPLNGVGYEAYNTNTLFPNPPSLFGATTVYLLSNKLVSAKSVRNILQPNDSDTLREIQSQNASEIMAIGITSAYGAYTVYYNNGSERGDYVLSQGVTLDSIDLQITDEFGNYLENGTNNTPVYLSLQVSYQ